MTAPAGGAFRARLLDAVLRAVYSALVFAVVWRITHEEEDRE